MSGFGFGKTELSIWQVYEAVYDKQKTFEEVHAMFDEFEDINEYRDEAHDSCSLIHTAANFLDYKGIELLLSKGARANMLTDKDETPLHFLAARHGISGWMDTEEGAERKCAELLLEAGVGIRRKNNGYLTCAHKAAERGRYEMLEVFAEKGLKLGFTDDKGNTPLHIAAVYAVNINKSLEYDTKSYNSVMEEHKSGAKLSSFDEQLIKQYEISRRDAENAFKSVKALMESGIEADEKNNDGDTAANKAQVCFDRRIQALMSGTYVENAREGSEDDLRMKTGGMTLPEAIMKADYEAMESILKLGANPDELVDGHKDFAGITPLSLAAIYMDERAVKILLDAGADPNLKDARGRNVFANMYDVQASIRLNIPVFRNRTLQKILKLLVDKGFDINLPADDNGFTPLNISCRNAGGETAFSKDPDAAGAAFADKNTGNVFTRSGVLIEELIYYGADPNIADIYGVTPLAYACQGACGYMEKIATALLESGAAVYTVDSESNTPLMYACANSNKSLGKTFAELLFEFGDPNVKAVNNNGASALEIAGDKDNERLVKFLLSNM